MRWLPIHEAKQLVESLLHLQTGAIWEATHDLQSCCHIDETIWSFKIAYHLLGGRRSFRNHQHQQPCSLCSHQSLSISNLMLDLNSLPKNYLPAVFTYPANSWLLLMWPNITLNVPAWNVICAKLDMMVFSERLPYLAAIGSRPPLDWCTSEEW